MRKIFFTLFTAFLAVTAFAQEPAIYSQYHVFPVLVNPGATGFDNKYQLVANARSAWAGFPGRPNSYTVMFNGPVGDKLALGGGLFSERLGDLRTTRAQLNYAFRFQIEKAKIGLGLSTEFLNRRADNDLLSNPTLDPGDPTIEQMVEGENIFDASMGAHILYDKKLMISFAVPNAIRARLDEVPTVGGNEEKSSKLFEHYMFQLGYIVDVPSQNFKIIPSLSMRKFRDTPYQIDLNVQGRFLEEKLIAGLTFRPSYQGTATLLLGSKYKQMEIYYSYDIAFSGFQSYSSGSHEISVAYNLKRKSKPGTTEAPAELYK